MVPVDQFHGSSSWTIEIHNLIRIMGLHEGFMEPHSWFVDLHNRLSEPHMQFCSSINREHWRRTIIRNYVSPSTELRGSINWIKELNKSIREIHQSMIMGFHMWVKELHNPTSFVVLNNWYLQPHSWFTEIQKRFVELLIYVFLIRYKEIHNVLWLYMELHKCNQYNIIDLWSPIIKPPRSGVTLMFSIRFRPVHHRRARRRNDFCL